MCIRKNKLLKNTSTINYEYLFTINQVENHAIISDKVSEVINEVMISLLNLN